MAKRLVLCSCDQTQSIDANKIAQATGLECSTVYKSLCYKEVEKAAEEIVKDDVIFACGQEIERFRDLAAELEVPEPAFIDLRDRAGWSADPADKSAKMAALLAEAALDLGQEKSIDINSEGTCFVFGRPEAVIRAADRLKDSLALTLLFSDPSEAPDSRAYDVMLGKIRSIKGALGQFEVTVDAAQMLDPTGRGPFAYQAPQDGGLAQCDIILDLSGEPAKVTAAEKREGYLRADPKDPFAVADATLEASQLIGVFEKPLYVALNAHLCAHSRAETVACSNCLDICPTGAILPSGDHVEIDPMICAGCGSCSAVCPSGAISYDAPATETILRRIRTLAEAYRSAGGSNPHLLVTDTALGSDMIAAAARHYEGLPANCIPMTVTALSSFGHAEMTAALACGFASVDILLPPNADRTAFDRELPLAQAICGVDKIRLIEEADPEAMCQQLYSKNVSETVSSPVIPLGSRRQATRLSAQALHGTESVLALPENAPYGAISVNKEACTLCLSCASLCPSGALVDNPDKPELKFQEDACLQCGLCANICPEKAIELVPQLNLTDTALSQVTLNEEDPFACIECGALFGVKSTVERILEKLGGKHAMFASEKAARMIQMCDNCRVNAQFHMENNPFSAGDRPRIRTTEDYFSDRKDH